MTPLDMELRRVAVALHNRLACIPNGIIYTSGFVLYAKGLTVGTIASEPDTLLMSKDVSDPAVLVRLEAFAQALRGLGWKVLSADTLKDYPQ